MDQQNGVKVASSEKNNNNNDKVSFCGYQRDLFVKFAIITSTS